MNSHHPAPPATTATDTLPLDRIRPNPDNPRRLALRREDIERIVDEVLVGHDLGHQSMAMARFLDAVESHALELVRIDDVAGEQLEGLVSLARQIDRLGLLQPIVVTSASGVTLHEADWVIVAGERRYLAHHLLGRREIRARRDLTLREAEDRRLAALVENLGRVDLGLPDKLRAFEGITQLFREQNPGAAVTAQALQDLTGESIRSCQRYLRYLNAPEGLKARLLLGELTGEGFEAAMRAARPAPAHAAERPVPEEGGGVRRRARRAGRLGRSRKSVSMKTADGVLVRRLVEACARAYPGGAWPDPTTVDWDDMSDAQEALDACLKTLATQPEPAG